MTLLQHSQLSQHGEYRHVSVSERQRSRPCGQNLRVPFLRTVLPPEVEHMIALEQWRPTARQNRSYLYHQSEFQHNYFDFVSLHHSDHDGVLRIFVGHSEIVKRLLITLFTRHNFSYTRSVTLHYAAQFSLYQECNNSCCRKPLCRVMLQYFACEKLFVFLPNLVFCDLTFVIFGFVFHNLNPSLSYYKVKPLLALIHCASCHCVLLYNSISGLPAQCC